MTDILKLWEEKKLYDKHDENHVLQSQEFDSIARAILCIAKRRSSFLPEEAEAIEWAENRTRPYSGE